MDKKNNNCRIGIPQLPVSFLETAIVGRHSKANIKNIIIPVIEACVKSYCPVFPILAFRIASIVEFINESWLSVTLNIKVIELTKTSLVVNVAIKDAQTLQSKPNGIITD